MTSNFLGDLEGESPWRGIISANELSAREGVNLQKGMNYRPHRVLAPQLSVFLVLPSHEGEYRDEWHEDQQLYIYEGHDSTTVESGKAVDQLMMYESGRLSDNGKFYKAANSFKDGITKEPVQIQVYEKLDPGVWYDKGIFNLIEAKQVSEKGRKVFKFFLKPADATLNIIERMLPAAMKAAAWSRAKGRCEQCGSESDLHFVGSAAFAYLFCSIHSS
jgi:hypothetical protein